MMNEIIKEMEKTYNYQCGYHQSRVDLLMPYDVESIEELIENVQKKARADAIMNVIQEVERLDHKGGGILDLMFYLYEQLKEQKNV